MIWLAARARSFAKFAAAVAGEYVVRPSVAMGREVGRRAVPADDLADLVVDDVPGDLVGAGGLAHHEVGAIIPTPWWVKASSSRWTYPDLPGRNWRKVGVEIRLRRSLLPTSLPNYIKHDLHPSPPPGHLIGSEQLVYPA